MTMMKTDKTKVNLEIPTDMLKVRALNDSQYRETQLKKIRAQAK